MQWPFVWIALGLGLLLALVLLTTGALADDAERALPLLTQLMIAEFGFFLTAIGAGAGLRASRAGGFTAAQAIAVAGCVLLAGGFLWLGVRLWPGGGGL